MRTSSVALIRIPLSKEFLMLYMMFFIPVDLPLPRIPMNA